MVRPSKRKALEPEEDVHDDVDEHDDAPAEKAGTAEDLAQKLCRLGMRAATHSTPLTTFFTLTHTRHTQSC